MRHVRHHRNHKAQSFGGWGRMLGGRAGARLGSRFGSTLGKRLGGAYGKRLAEHYLPLLAVQVIGLMFPGIPLFSQQTPKEEQP